MWGKLGVLTSTCVLSIKQLTLTPLFVASVKLKGFVEQVDLKNNNKQTLLLD